MSILTASTFNSNSAHASACEVFNMPLETGDIEIKHESWGIAVNVLSGPDKGFYDAWKEDGVYKFLVEA